nr:hypothetical protein CFP56_53687 [Quercus suber]
MTEVIIPPASRRFHKNTSSISSIPRNITAANMSEMELLPNPDFSFPMLPQANVLSASAQDGPKGTTKRPVSMQIDNGGSSTNRAAAHRRAVSTLPSFTFNAANSSGLHDNSTPPMTPVEPVATTPSRRGHRRGHSEFVGGDSRFGVVEAISSSPTKISAAPLPIQPLGPRAGRRGHAHRRSAAMSSHDVSSIMDPAEIQPRLSSSLPGTPLEHPQTLALPTVTDFKPLDDAEDIFGSPSNSSGAKPPFRPRVGFSDEIEYIPRPLSTISSGTESSPSTLHGHSVNNSISSMLSLGTPSPPYSRTNPRFNLSTTFEDETRQSPRSFGDISKGVEKEGEWLKSRPSIQDLVRPVSESSASSPSLSFAPMPQVSQPRDLHRKRQSLGHVLGFDRRRSAPDITAPVRTQSRLSALSLQDSSGEAVDLFSDDMRNAGRKPSSRKGFAWAASKILGKSSKPSLVQGDTSLENSRSVPAHESVVDDSYAPQALSETAKAETNLDAVFGELDEERLQSSDAPSQLWFERYSPSSSQQSSFQQQPRRASDDLTSSIDLDAALGPFNTPQFGNVRSRRDLHSSRGIRESTTVAMQNQRHFRTASAPMLQSFHLSRSSSPSKLNMPVFAEEDEDDSTLTVHSSKVQTPAVISELATPAHDRSLGVHVVDSATNDIRGGRMAEDEPLVSVRRGDAERSFTRLVTHGSTLDTPMVERRPSSVVEETILEESSPVEAIDIVSSEEEPRASSLTKSSDSSDTPTILAAHTDRLPLPDGHAFSLMTPDTFTTSSLNSPDLTRRQGSFDTSRLGTSTSSIGDARTMSSFATGEHSHDNRVSVDGVPSLTSSRSTMRSTMHANDSHRELISAETPAYPLTAGPRNVPADLEHRRKRTSIASLSQLMGSSFSPKSRGSTVRPQTAIEVGTSKRPNKKEHRLKKLMFWKSINSSKQSLLSNT